MRTEARVFVAIVLATLRVSADTPPSSSSAPSSSAWPVVAGVTVKVALAPGATPMEKGLPTFDLSSVPGASIALRRGVARATVGQEGHAGDSLVAVCAQAPSSGFSEEVEPLVFEKLNELAKAEVAQGGPVDRWDVVGPTEKDTKIEETFSAEASLAASPDGSAAKLKERVEGRHVLAFLASGQAVACTIACTEFSTESARVCPAIMAATDLDGPFVAPPNPSFFGKIAVAAMRRPIPALGFVAGVAMMLGGVLLALLPPRRRAASVSVEDADD